MLKGGTTPFKGSDGINDQTVSSFLFFVKQHFFPRYLL